MDRRNFLKLSAALSAGLVLPVSLQREYLRRALAQGDTIPVSPSLTKFIDDLPIPGVLSPQGKMNGATYYEVTMDEVQQQVHRDMPGPTTFWGYQGLFPGPTIEARKNEKVTVRWINNLSADPASEHYLQVDQLLHGPDHGGTGRRVVVHLHGGNVPPEIDGYPEWTFLPGDNRLYENYPNRQDANTLWYHDHGLGITRLNVYMGLAGFWLIRDGFEDRLGLPSGAYEIPIAIQDRTFNADGSLWYPYPWQEEYFADTIVVNGKAWPKLEVEPRKYRFRFLNGSNGRAYWMFLRDETAGPSEHPDTGPGDMPFYQIGNDGGLLARTLNLNEILLAPAERADVIVDFTGMAAGTKLTLKNKADAPLFLNDGIIDQPDIMQFVVKEPKGKVNDRSVIPVDLRNYSPLNPADAVMTRDFVLDVDEYEPTEIRLAIKTLDPAWLNDDPNNWKNYVTGYLWDDIVGDETVAPDLPYTSDPQGPSVQGTVEIWRFWNITPDMHPMHVHLVNFQLLERLGDLQFDPEHPMFDSEAPPESPNFRKPVPAEGYGPKPVDANEVAWKDTLKMYAGQMTSIIIKWGTYTGLFPFHCHILDHEDHEMMRQVLVIQEPEIIDPTAAVG